MQHEIFGVFCFLLYYLLSAPAAASRAGFPSVGKSTLLTKLTGTFSEVRHTAAAAAAAWGQHSTQHSTDGAAQPNIRSLGVCLLLGSGGCCRCCQMLLNRHACCMQPCFINQAIAVVAYGAALAVPPFNF
jgi:hypothetical protein